MAERCEPRKSWSVRCGSRLLTISTNFKWPQRPQESSSWVLSRARNLARVFSRSGEHGAALAAKPQVAPRPCLGGMTYRAESRSCRVPFPRGLTGVSTDGYEGKAADDWRHLIPADPHIPGTTPDASPATVSSVRLNALKRPLLVVEHRLLMDSVREGASGHSRVRSRTCGTPTQRGAYCPVLLVVQSSVQHA